MAIDTQTKRRACNYHILPVPDGTIGAADREHVCWIYSGIAAGSPPISTGRNLLLMKMGSYIIFLTGGIYALDGFARN